MNPTRPAADFRRRAAALFDQQMWCLGRDIARPEGNVLLELGMCRYRPPDPTRSGTLYAAAVEPAGRLLLWGFGAMYAAPGLGGVFIRRYTFAPRLSARESAVGVFTPEQLGPLTGPVTARDYGRLRTLLPRLVGWFAGYEHWVAERFGTAYREQCLAARGKASAAPAGDMARDWDRVAKKCRRFRGSDGSALDPWQRFLHAHRPAGPAPRVPISRPSTRVQS